MDPISLALGIASFAAPRLAKWLGGDKAEDVANQVVGLAQSVTGSDNGTAALTALKSNPQALIEFQRQVGDLEVRLYEAETERMRLVNETMRSEGKTEDKYVRRWRPTIGYVVAGQLALLGIAIFLAVIGSTVAAFLGKADVVQVLLEGMSALMASLSAILGIELTVLGVNIAQRSKDKQVASGQATGPGLIGAISQRIAGVGGG